MDFTCLHAIQTHQHRDLAGSMLLCAHGSNARDREDWLPPDNLLIALPLVKDDDSFSFRKLSRFGDQVETISQSGNGALRTCR
ncbi:MAG TPA: hypothetical protein DHW63_10250 [Hyphomonadaceae bacterium]|nr:hypothetical protein [Hyphomonadaceae bacterium]